jgi:sulfate transport system substrate-binding protein
LTTSVELETIVELVISVGIRSERIMRDCARIGRWIAAVALVPVVSGCRPARDPNTDVLKLGAYSVVREVLGDGLLPAFAAQWKSRTGRELKFTESYNASGAQARAIASGFDADIAILSHEGDMDILVKAGRVKPTWRDGPNGGIITHSLVVIGHRPGNAKGIKDWSDLAKPGVGVLYPDPKSSGGARWNINAIYGSAYIASRSASRGGSDTGAIGDLMRRVQANVINMDQSGRQSMANFAERGTGDAVVTYENELLLRNRESQPIPYVIPPATLLIEGPAAMVETAVESHGSRAVAEAFLEFMHSDRGQQIIAEFGFRPVNPAVPPPHGAQPLPPRLFTMADLGGWAKLEQELYGPRGLWTSVFTAETSQRASGR